VRKALVVGINEYTNCNSLGGCENDATAVKEVLKLHANDDLNFNVVEPQFDVSTKVGLFDEIGDFFGSSSSEVEVALFYFAGHLGLHTLYNKYGLFVLYDGFGYGLKIVEYGRYALKHIFPNMLAVVVWVGSALAETFVSVCQA